ncbi:MAG: polysaccharide biosynthesis C-terminal domain-containing protein, partial [Lactococcus lactis]|nr:polysaccharide biosynthesis C-terminal domain-containing protein [Lactococcus lactis]
MFWGIIFLSWITAAISLFLFFLFLFISKDYRSIYIWQSLLILTSLFDISWYFMGREKFSITVTRNFIFKLLTVLSILIFVKKPSDLILYVAIMSLGGLFSSLSLWPFLRDEVNRPNFAKLNLKKHLRYTFVLFLPTIAMQVYLVANKTMIGLMDSISHAGFYQQSDTIIKLALSIIGTIGVVMMPHVANMFSTGNIKGIRNSIIKTFNIASGISFGILFGILAIALKFAPFFFGKSFSMVGMIMMIEAPIILFISMSSVLGTQYLLPLNRMKPFTMSVTLGAILNIIINLILIPWLGVIGAAIATVISEFAVTAFQYYSIRKEFTLKELFGGVWKYVLSGFQMFVIVFIMNQKNELNGIQLFIQIFTGVVI